MFFYVIIRMKRNVTWLVIVLTCSSYLTLTQIPSTRRQAPTIDSTNHTVEEGFIQKKRQMLSLLLGGQNLFNTLPCLALPNYFVPG